MASNYLSKGIKRTALSVALAACFVGGVHAQSNTAGSVFGQATAGDTIVIENPSTGFTREIQVGANGNYRASSLQTGSYRVTIKRADGTQDVRENVVVNVGTGTNVSFVSTSASGEATTLDAVTVTGAVINPIDVSSVESNTIMTEQQIDRLPVSRDITNVALLAPGTVRGDGRFGNLASFGGSSVAENVYYINGFNVTNIINGLAFSNVPFEAIAETQIKNGGYGAEFGRSLGGVVNVITKRGSNDWHFGGNLIYSPDSMRGDNIRWVKDSNTGNWNPVKVNGYNDALRYNVYASGPIVKDRLFFYALAQGEDNTTRTYGINSQSEQKSDAPQYFAKIDWNITDNHILELTAFRDRTEDDYQYWDSLTPYGKGKGNVRLPSSFQTGGDNYFGKWTGYFGDNLTLSALYGVGKYDRTSQVGSSGCPIVQDQRGEQPVSMGCWATSLIDRPDASDKRTAYRFDGEWVLGDHTIRFGLDNEKYEFVGGQKYSGPDSTWNLIRTLGVDSRLSNGYVNETGAPIDYVYRRTLENGGIFEIQNSAYYIEDSWQVTDNFLAYLGIRNEAFKNLNANGVSFIDIDNTWAPRLGFSWDVNGDSSLKIFGNAGRYYIPVYGNTNIRLAGAETDYQEYYVWDGTYGTDDLELPGLGAQLGDRLVISNGETPDPRTVVDPNLDPMYQDEFILGFQAQLSQYWSGGLRAIYRNLKSAMDDVCSGEYAYNWAISAGYSEDQAEAIGGTVDHCFLYNVGKDLTANVDLDGNGQLTPVRIPASGLGLPEAKRTYQALEFFFERAWDGKYSVQGSYTWSRSRGNIEGYVKSDIGQDDAGITQDFDYPGLMEGAYGYLPNDRRHTFKIFGAYQIADEWRIGANYIVQSGRPVNCLGYYAGGRDSVAIEYGAASFYCNSQLNPRGTRGRLEWSSNLGMQLTYEPKWAEGLRLSMDVFNVFDDRDVLAVNETGESAQNTPNPTYLQPISVQPARQFRFTVQYDF